MENMRKALAMVILSMALIFGGILSSQSSSVAIKPIVLKQSCVAENPQPIIDSFQGGILDFNGKCFIYNQTVLIHGRNDLVIKNLKIKQTTDGSELPAWDGKEVNWPRHRMAINLKDSVNVQLINIAVESINTSVVYNADLEAQHGVGLGNSIGTKIIGLSVRYVYGDTIAFGSSVGGTAQKIMGYGIGRQGISITNSRNATIDGCSLENVRRSAFDLEPTNTVNGQSIDGAVIRNCTIKAPIGNVILAAGNNQVKANILFEYNTVLGEAPWMKLGGNNITVRNNDFSNYAIGTSGDTDARGISINWGDGFLVTENVFNLLATPPERPINCAVKVNSLAVVNWQVFGNIINAGQEVCVF